MKSAETKTTTARHLTKGQGQQLPFFQREKAGSALENGQARFFTPNGSDGIQHEPFFAKPTIQPKLRIGEPGDKYEQEADSVADKVVQRLAQTENGSEQPLSTARPALQRKPIFESESAPEVQTKSLNGHTRHAPQVQRKCDECEQGEELQKMEEPGEEEALQMKPIFDSAAPPPEEDGVQRTSDPGVGWGVLQPKCAKCADEEGEAVQRKETTDGTTSPRDDLSSRLNSSKGGGSHLPESTRVEMEGSFGADFSNVRIHTDTRAEQMNQAVQAHAFTHGSDIYFNSGKYDPGSKAGQRLLGHELTHTVQQGASVQRKEEGQAERGRAHDNPAGEVSTGADAVQTGLPGSAQQATEDKVTGATVDLLFHDLRPPTQSEEAFEESGSPLRPYPHPGAAATNSPVLRMPFDGLQREGEDRLARGLEVYDLLEGWTSSADSAEILKRFTGLTKADVNALMNIVALHASISVFGVYKWLHDDMVTSDWKALLKIFIKLNSVDLNEVIAFIIVNDYLEGWTSADDSKEILGHLSAVPGSQLDGVLAAMETKAEKKQPEMVAYLFGEMQDVDAQSLAQALFVSGSLKGIDYAVFWQSNKIFELLKGYTGIRDSRSIVQNFQRAGGKGEKADTASQVAVLTKLSEFTLQQWGKTSEQALMEFMWQEDYNELHKMLPNNLKGYSIEKNFLSGAWDKIVIGYDYVEGFLEYAACGIVGIIVGIFDAVVSIASGIIDIGFAVKNLVGWLISKASGGRFARESEENVNNFFIGLGEALGAPLDLMSKMWNATKEEASMIEGPFEECQLAIFWVRKLANFVVNILLLIFAGYGAVKAAIEALEAIKQISTFAEVASKLGKLPVAVLRKIKSIPGSLAAGGSRIVSAIRNVDSIAGAVRKTIGVIRLAARDPEYFLGLRRAAGTFLEGKVKAEKEWWGKRKEIWSESATTEEAKIAKSEELVNTSTGEAESNPSAAEQKSTQAEGQAIDAQNKTNAVEKELKSGKTEEADLAKKQPAVVPLRLQRQVEYGSTDLSRLVTQERLRLGRSQVGPPKAIKGQSKANFAVFEYDDSGTLKHVVRKSEIFGGGHSEQIIHKELQALGVKPEQVTRIYSERAPCSTKGCSALIQNNYVNAEVTFSFEFGADKASMDAGNAAHAKAVDALFGKKD